MSQFQINSQKIATVIDLARDAAIAAGMDDFEAQKLSEDAYEWCANNILDNEDLTEEQAQIEAERVAARYF